MNPYFRAMRLERWPRSTAIFLGSAAFFFLSNDSLSLFSLPSLIGRSILAYLLTWSISTANYIVNEIADAPYDIHHPTKRDRPLVRGEIKKVPFILIGLALAMASFSLALAFFSMPFFLSLFLLLLAGFIYNIKPVRTKDIPFLDAISESANNPIRFLIGWYAFSPAQDFPPLSLLAGWWAFGNFLMVAKRLSEFRYLKEKAVDYRASHKKYSQTSLLLGMAASAVIFFGAYLLFALDYNLQTFLYLSPLLIIYFFLIVAKTWREREIMEEPENLLKRPLFAIYTLFLLLLFFLAFFFEI